VAAPATRGIAAAGVLALVLWGLGAASARAEGCGGAFVSRGDTETQVREKCGAPIQEDTWRVDLLGRPEAPPPAPTPAIAMFRDSEWIYNPGPRHLLLSVRFRDGRVVATESLGPGFAHARREMDRCRSGLFELGEPRVTIKNFCGNPANEESRTDHRGRTAFGRSERVHVRIQGWTYDFGPRSFKRKYWFENGRLVRIETLERGG
jgi:hypothetical protein